MEIEKIYEKYKRMLMDIAVRIVQNEDDAEDILQTAFLKLFQKNIKNEKQALSYLIKTVAGRAKNRKYRVPILNLDDPEPLSFSPEQNILKQELNNKVKNAIGQLPYKERLILIMKKYEGFSHKEISKILKIREGTVRVLLYRGMRKLEKKLMPYISGGNDEKRDEN